MNLSDADRRAILVHLEQIRAIVRGPVGAEPPMAGDVVEVAESYAQNGHALHAFTLSDDHPGCAVCGYARSERLMHFAPQPAETDSSGRLREAVATADLQIGDGHIEAARTTLHAAMEESSTDTDGGVAQQAAATASRGIYAGAWCRYGKSCPHPNVCQLAPGGCTDRRDVFREPA